MVKTKTKKYRGTRTCGGGTSKNRRGAGNRGGRGNSGTRKHNVTRSMKRGQTFGKYGFEVPKKNIYKESIVNVGELDELIEQLVDDGIAEEKDGAYHIDLNSLDINKVLGAGKVTKSLVVTARNFSNAAKDKIEKSNGTCIESE
ncbi:MULTISPECIES: uL15m family ribosomal protein [Methanohalobium]|jgi:large subunit ribosomal protein L15|uniref:Large ribosomal subunit protein uL15 n=1 Tax=Methanohalobium evestigatum (strain ATCC BAA-1072 / DSM 3721 / NBRC 107634 / OCM 161 / Z-7303) TaxID=644295 RepID=D7E8R3_METEZ|nr:MULTISPECIES: uL15 family ribosomal protein [Methanohalobium]ADI73734.1 ribosomal protein L15 [Methanohalobium evestigatum Z-7303]